MQKNTTDYCRREIDHIHPVNVLQGQGIGPNQPNRFSAP